MPSVLNGSALFVNGEGVGEMDGVPVGDGVVVAVGEGDFVRDGVDEGVNVGDGDGDGVGELDGCTTPWMTTAVSVVGFAAVVDVPCVVVTVKGVAAVPDHTPRNPDMPKLFAGAVPGPVNL